MGRIALAGAVCAALAALAGCGEDETTALNQGRIVFVYVSDTPEGWAFSLGRADLTTGKCRRIRPLPTSLYGQEAPFPTISPTGEHIAQIVARRGTAELRLTSLTTGRTRVVTKIDLYPDVVWSADGRRLAYKHGRVWRVIAVAGHPSAASVVRVDALGFAWAPDGRLIAFVSKTGDGRARTLRATLDVMSVDGRGRRTLFVEPNPYASSPEATWSPDGKTLVIRTEAPPRGF